MLQMSKEQIAQYGEENIGELLTLIQPYLAHREKLYKQYRRKNHENQLMGDGVKKKIVPFEYYIVNMVQGYIGGKAPMYSVSTPTDYALAKNSSGNSDEEKADYVKRYTEAIEYIRRYNDDAATYVELVHDYLTTTAAYAYIYENENNEIVYARFDSRQTVGIYDFETPPNLIGVTRHWKQKDDKGNDVDVIELITEQHRRRYNGSKIIDEEELAWDDVPCIALEQPDGIAIFEPAAGEIAAYENNLNNVMNMTQYNDNAKLLLKSYRFSSDALKMDSAGNMIPNPEREVEEQAIMQAICLCVGEKGDVAWLTKNVDYTGVLETLKRYHDLITMLTGVPNMTDEAFANADNASALGYKLYALDQFSATFDRVAKKALLRLWEIITNRLNLKGENFDFRDINITLQRNIPTDKDKSLERALNAYKGNLISQETALNESQLEVDAKEEMERLRRETEEDYNATLQRVQNGQMEDGEEEWTMNSTSETIGNTQMSSSLGSTPA